MRWFISFMQVYAWLGVPEVSKDCLKSFRVVFVELCCLAVSLLWIALSPVITVWGMCFPAALMRFMQWGQK